MTVRELIKQLEQFDLDMEVALPKFHASLTSVSWSWKEPNLKQCFISEPNFNDKEVVLLAAGKHLEFEYTRYENNPKEKK